MYRFTIRCPSVLLDDRRRGWELTDLQHHRRQGPQLFRRGLERIEDGRESASPIVRRSGPVAQVGALAR